MDEQSVTAEPLSAIEHLTCRVGHLEAELERVTRLLGAATDRPMRVGAVAERLNVNRSTIHRWIAEGRCPARMWQGRWEIPAAWVRDCLVHGTPSN